MIKRIFASAGAAALALMSLSGPVGAQQAPQPTPMGCYHYGTSPPIECCPDIWLGGYTCHIMA